MVIVDFVIKKAIDTNKHGVIEEQTAITKTRVHNIAVQGKHFVATITQLGKHGISKVVGLPNRLNRQNRPLRTIVLTCLPLKFEPFGPIWSVFADIAKEIFCGLTYSVDRSAFDIVRRS